MAKEIRLSAGKHFTPFDKRGEATMCVQEYTSYLAGEPHSASPRCVSLVLTRFMVPLNDGLDDESRQRLRPYAVRQIGTAGDDQDKARSYMALDWFVRTCTPDCLAAVGLTEEADRLRRLAPIEGTREVEEVASRVSIDWDAVQKSAGGMNYWDLIWAPLRAAAQGAVERGAELGVWDAAGLAIWVAAAYAALKVDLNSVVKPPFGRPPAFMVQESAFRLLDRMIDPAGLHDIKDEAACFEETGREPLMMPTV